MAHNLKIAGAEYDAVSKVTFTDTSGTSRAYLDADEVYTKEQAAQLIKDDKNTVKDIAITLNIPDVIIWEGSEDDVEYATAKPSDVYKLWVELK